MPDGRIENSSLVSPIPPLLQTFSLFCFVFLTQYFSLNNFAASVHIQLGKEISGSFFAGTPGICKGFSCNGHIAFSVYLGARAGLSDIWLVL